MELCVKTVKTLCVLLLSHCMVGTVASAGKCFSMSPNHDVFLLVGSDLQLNCTLKTPSIDTGCVQNYIVNNTRILKGNQDLPADIFDYHVADKTLMMTIRNVTLEDSGTYICRYGDSDLTETFRLVHIGEPPGDPEGLSCVSANFDDLKCSFSLSRQPVNIPLDWTMVYKMVMVWPGQNTGCNVTCSSNPDSGIICERFPCECCQEAILYHYTMYEIFVHGVNKDYNLQVNKTFTVQTNESIVKPNPVSELGFNIANDSSNVKLHWDGPRGLTYQSTVNFAMDYKITVTSLWDDRTEMVENAMESHIVYNLTDLIPFANYSVTVQAKPTAAHRDIYWSENSTVEFETLSAVSEHSVYMTTGSFLMLDCGQKVMCPIIYWKNPERMFWNGPITGYKVIVEEFELEKNMVTVFGHISKRHIGKEAAYRLKRVIKPLSENITGISVSGALLTTMMRNEDYRVEVMLINSVGVSTSSSEILIPNKSIGEMLKPVWVAVEMVESSSVYISWHIDPEHCANISSVTYYWCLSDSEKPLNSTFVSCKDNFDWITVNITDGCGNATGHKIEKTLNQPGIRYAVSVEANGISGGLIWEKFRFNKHDVPEMPLYSVTPEGASLIVKILYREYYVSEGGRPDQYTVVYSECQEGKDCSSGETKRTFTANFTKPVYKIDNLKPGTEYSIYVTSENSFGKSLEGEPVKKTIYEETKPSATPVILGAVLGSLTFGIFIVLTIFLCRRKHKKWRDSSRIKVPEWDETSMLNGSYRKDTDNLVTKVDTMLKQYAGESKPDISNTLPGSNSSVPVAVPMCDRISNAELSDEHDSGKGSDSPSSSLGQMNPVQQPNGVTESAEDQQQGPSSAGTDCGSDEKHLILEKQESSPTLSGYRKNVLGASSNGQCTVDIFFDESGAESEKSNENKETSIVNLDINKVPKHTAVPVENLDSPEIQRSKENIKKESRDLSINCEKSSVDYSVVAIHQGQNEEGLNDKNLIDEPKNDGSSRDKIAVLEKIELTEKDESKNSELNKELTNSKPEDPVPDSVDAIKNEKCINDKSENSTQGQNVEIVDEIKDVTVESCAAMTDQGNNHVDETYDEEADNQVNGDSQEMDEFLEDFDSHGNEIKAFCDLDENNEEPWDSPYKNPDEVSLGDGSTISDVSDSGDINSDDFSDRKPDIGSEIGEMNNFDEDNNKLDSNVEGSDRMVTCKEEQDKEGDKEKSDIGTGISIEQVVASKNECHPANAVLGARKDTNSSGDFRYSGNTGPDDIISAESKSTSEPASLEPYIRAVGKNGFVKNPNVNDKDWKKVASLKLSQKNKNTDKGSVNLNKEDTQMSRF